MTISSTFKRDANRVPITTNGLTETKEITYAAGSTGAIGAATLFTVKGDVLARIFAVCSANLTSGGVATIEVGIAGNTASLIALSTATDIDAGEVWIDTAPATVEPLPAQNILTNGTDIIQTIADATVTGGVLKYYCLWTPLSETANIVAT